MRNAAGAIARYELSARDVHLWAVRLTASGETRRACQRLLSAAETHRAGNFALDRLREAYELSQGALRLLLSGYLKHPAQDFVFEFGAKGKPALCGHASLKFNKSHTSGLALYAFAAECEVGVDVEKLREIPYASRIAERFFAAGEHDQPFLPLWTKKEAYVKALGVGLFSPLDQAFPANWTIEPIELDDGYTAAIAYEGPPKQVRLHPVITCDELLVTEPWPR